MKKVLLFFLLLSLPATASVIYDNLAAPTVSFDGVCNPSAVYEKCYGPLADSFSTGRSPSYLTRVGILLKKDAFAGGDGQTAVGLYSDQGGKPGADVLELGIIKDSELTSVAEDFFFPTTFPLALGTRYWIELIDTSVTDETAVDWGWCLASCRTAPGVAGEYFWNRHVVWDNSSGPYQMKIEATVNPEPASWLLLGSGLLAAYLSLRRIKK